MDEKGPRHAYFVLVSIVDKKGRLILCYAVEGEKDYHKTATVWETDINLAQERVNILNAMLGVQPKEAVRIIRSTLWR